MIVKINGAALFALFFLLVFFVAVLTAKDWYFTARLFPLFAGIPGLVLAAVQFWRELTRWESRNLASGVQMDQAYDESADATVQRRRTMRFALWLLTTSVGIWAFGLPLALSVSLAYWVRSEGEESWVMSLGFGVGTLLVVWGLFTRVFGLGWPPGEIFRIFGLPHLFR